KSSSSSSSSSSSLITRTALRAPATQLVSAMVRICGHGAHPRCYARLLESARSVRSMADRQRAANYARANLSPYNNETVCPLCKRRACGVLPVRPLASAFVERADGEDSRAASANVANDDTLSARDEALLAGDEA